ncbi:hypothetical protein ACFQS7_08930 [Dankookia sp. GCM10030260]|uniref:hypothetical protein n=1 Tax=Dankookia sp. GCM10030260 TaxID=3273390 RepID=UPI003612B7C3
MTEATDAVWVKPMIGEPALVEPPEAAEGPGVLEGHILTLRDGLAATAAAAAEARRLAEERAEALAALAPRVDAAEAERDAARAEATAATAALHAARSDLLALANRRRWETVAHAAQRAEAAAMAQAAREALAAATVRFQTASQAIVAQAESEASALRGQVEAANAARDAAQRDLARWRRGGRLARMLRAWG